jgi:hypothetical protein
MSRRLAARPGIVLNIVTGAALWLAARRKANLSIHGRYFAWLAMA